MAQMNVSDSFNLTSFADHVEKNLNGFQTLLLRLTKEMKRLVPLSIKKT